jgi:hypothetical protein
MQNTTASQPGSGSPRTQSLGFPFAIVTILGCLLALIGFFYLNWNVSFYDSSLSTYPFLNGPGVFQKMVLLYDTLASLWIWITPAAAVVALALACAGWLWNTRLLPLVAIPAGAGLVLLINFVLAGDQWDYYKSSGYGLAVLGLLIVLASGLWARWSESLNTYQWSESSNTYQKNDTSPIGLAWCALAGGGLIFLSFFLPWLLLRTPFIPITRTPSHFPPPYQGVSISGLSLASEMLPFLPVGYTRLYPAINWLLWLVPLAGLSGAIAAWMSLRGRPVSRWLWILISLVPLPLYLFLLRSAVQGSTSTYGSPQANVTTYGWHLTLLGLTLMFFSGLLWKKGEQETKTAQQDQHRIRDRRLLLGGIAGTGLVAVAYGSYIFWQTSKMYSATLVLPLPDAEHDEYGSVAWATDGRRLAVTSYTTLWLWDVVTKKPISKIAYPPSILHSEAHSTSLVWSPDQRFLAVAVGEIMQVYEIDSEKLVSHWTAGHLNIFDQGIAWSADSQQVATTSDNPTSQNNGVEIYDAATGKQVRAFTFPPTVRDVMGNLYSLFECKSVAWSADNRWLAVGGQIQSKDDIYRVFFTVWDVASGAQVMNESYVSNTANTGFGFQLYITVSWSPDGKRLAIASDTTGVKLWDVPNKKLLRTYIGAGGRFGKALAWSPDGKQIAASESNVVRIWDTTSNQTLFSYRGHANMITGLSWSSHGNTIASSSIESVRIWQPES